jgi:hypothetical protein
MQKTKIVFTLRKVEYSVELTDRQMLAIANTLGIIDGLFSSQSFPKMTVKAIANDETCDFLQSQLTRYGITPALPSIVDVMSNQEIQTLLAALLKPMADVKPPQPLASLGDQYYTQYS